MQNYAGRRRHATSRARGASVQSEWCAWSRYVVPTRPGRKKYGASTLRKIRCLMLASVLRMQRADNPVFAGRREARQNSQTPVLARCLE